MAKPLDIRVKGMDKVQKALRKFPEEVQSNLDGAGREAGEEVLNTEGLRQYPPATAANTPPPPYYIRGRGTQYQSYNTGSSERYGTQFFVDAQGLRTTIGNRASYAQWLTDEDRQARAMAEIGWRKLVDVAREKSERVIQIFEGWVGRTIQRLGL